MARIRGHTLPHVRLIAFSTCALNRAFLGDSNEVRLKKISGYLDASFLLFDVNAQRLGALYG